MAARQSRLVRKKRLFFDFNWLPWQRPLRYRKKGRNSHLQFNTYCMVQRLSKSVERILRYFSSERTSSRTKQNWLPWQRPLRNRKTGPENSRKYLPFGEKIVRIGPVDTEIALLIVKNEGKKKKLTQAKYIALLASLPSGLK